MTQRRNFIKNAALLSFGAVTGKHLPLNLLPQNDKLVFPKNFLFGASSSAYQIEGAHMSDGKGESIWDRFTHIPGRTKQNGDTAALHYKYYKEDIALLKDLGVNTYRFSIAWTRIFPDGYGQPNKKGVQFYKDIVNMLHDQGIKPNVTLYHWDLPQNLQDKGGWANRQTADYFAQYARYMFEQLGNRVPLWATHNEPWVSTFVGHWLGNMAPGIKDLSTALLVSHNMLLAHGKAVKAFRQTGNKGEIGITLDLQYVKPATDSKEDQLAADIVNHSHHAWFADPILKGEYPADIWQIYKKQGLVLPKIKEGDLQTISQPIDFLGLNYYYTDWFKKVEDKEGWWPYGVSSVKSETHPEGLYDLLQYLHKRYNKKIIITENGKSINDEVPDAAGKINDTERIKYVYEHLKMCRKAIDNGVNLAGYYIWSFLDDYEWDDFGRMGLVYIDYDTMKRTIKKSGHWYANGIKNGFSL